MSQQPDMQASAAGNVDASTACPPFSCLGSNLKWGRDVCRTLIRASQKSGGPAAVPSEALVSDRPTVFLTALNIPHHRYDLVELRMGPKSLVALQKRL